MSAKQEDDTPNDEMVSSFLAFTGSADPAQALSYLEMSGNNLETAVGLFMDNALPATSSSNTGSNGITASHTTSTASNPSPDWISGDPNGGVTSSASGGMDAADAAAISAAMNEDAAADIRAPDQTRTMRLMDHDDDHHHGSSGSANLPGILNPDNGGVLMGTFSAPPNSNQGGAMHRLDSLEYSLDTASRRASDESGAFTGSFLSAMTSSATSGHLNQSASNSHFDARAMTNAAAAATGEDGDINTQIMDNTHHSTTSSSNVIATPTLSDMFAPPLHLMHRAGGFQGARNVARDARRWLLVNLQRDEDFACHALNRDVWRDELIGNLVQEGFIFWQQMDNHPEGMTYSQRYNVTAYPHVAIIDPRTGRLMWKKEGWTQVNPMTAEMFAETAADFCSRHSFDKPPTASKRSSNGTTTTTAASTSSASQPNNSQNKRRPIQDLSEEQQLQAAIRASMSNNDMDLDDNGDDDDDDELSVDDSSSSETTPDEPKTQTMADQFSSVILGEEPSANTTNVVRIQFRMPNGSRTVRRFLKSDSIRLLYKFVIEQQDQVEDTSQHQSFEIMAGFPPKDLYQNLEDGTVDSCGLAGESLTVRWKN
mmetsp:Transcript_12156/g.17589  ORF Transcript_12156/g.17589 Transcript_12156/m.17589 type:complete len:597 (+) Transcript_12156:178-1968(+)|eukprot:CAMPEP_0195531984 /NCGR_PEP_ID=MMETSP0794_2-20130614/36854_1 /TAXON_ID=515487 /ORGANISM="Stephanopyxis turris, Strain CCMP 815" /LENGTH=596 /DNA_ID=CAMNT_0040663989 /DNA_START=111 /DNA_END=1901 /DNA_ORIENTATION=+